MIRGMRLIRAYPTPFFVAALFVVLVIALAAVGGQKEDDEVESEWDVVQRERGKAVAKCEAVVKGDLKAPSTAKLNLSASGNGPTYVVSGTVDAENSFGAMLRKDVRCNVRITNDGDSVSVTGYSGLR